MHCCHTRSVVTTRIFGTNRLTSLGCLILLEWVIRRIRVVVVIIIIRIIPNDTPFRQLL